MPNMLPRLLYILAALAWFLLLRLNPVTSSWPDASPA